VDMWLMVSLELESSPFDKHLRTVFRQNTK
jgi:hypothetical protein